MQQIYVNWCIGNISNTYVSQITHKHWLILYNDNGS